MIEGRRSQCFSGPVRIVERYIKPHARPIRYRKPDAMSADDARAFVLANCLAMTVIEMGVWMGRSEQEVRKLCRELGVRSKRESGERQPCFAPDFEPDPDDAQELACPPGTLARALELRRRADAGLPLWDDGETTSLPLPQCAAKPGGKTP